MHLRSVNGDTGALLVEEVSGDFIVRAQVGNLELRTNTVGKYILTNDRLGVRRAPLANDLEVEGTASKTTASAWLANSDRRIKQDIAPLGHALETLRKVQPVSFLYTAAHRGAPA